MLLILLIAFTAWLIGLLMPWWSFAIPCLVLGGWLGKKGKTAFLYGFLGIGGLWLIQAGYIDAANDGILSSRIADLLGLPHSLFVILLTAVIGGLAGGLSTLTGYYFTKLSIVGSSENFEDAE